jgi:hypothetical protein
MMPVPTHLRGLVTPLNDLPNEEPLEAVVRRPCTGETFELLYPGVTAPHNGSVFPVTCAQDGAYFFRIEADCTRCRARHLLFDAHFHGWDGDIFHDEQKASLPRPALTPRNCLKCSGTSHTAQILIQTEGSIDFIENTNGEFPADRWPDGFGWFTVSTTCASCQLETDGWVDYETT